MGWKVNKLDSLLKIQNGYAFDSKKFVDSGGLPLIRIRDISNGFGTVVNYDGDYDEKYRVIKGDFLIGMDGEFRCYEWKGDDALLNQRVCRLQEFSEELYPRFLFYGINKYLKDIEDVTSFTTVKHISARQIKEIEFPLPSTSEQKRIVTILDQAFTDIEQARAKTEQNLKNARELFVSYLQQVFSSRGEGVIELPLSEITESISDGDHAAPPKSEDGIPFITISNINKLTNEIDFTNTFKVPESYYSALKITRKPLQGDVLYTVTGSYGIPVIVKEEKEFCFQRHIGLVRPNNNTDSNWLYYLLMSPQVFKQADEGATGTAQKTVSLKLLRSLRVPKVPLKEQVNMVEGLNFMHQKSKQLTEIYTRKLESLDELKKSILQKAFSGELSKDKEGAAA